MSAVHRRGLLAVGVLALAALYGPALLAHARHAADPLWFNDDARIYTWPLLRYADPALFPNDPIADYVLTLLPVGYEGMYRVTGPWLDAIRLSAVLPYAGLLVVLGATALAAGRIGGAVAGLAALWLALSGDVLLERMAGGMPRAFAFPLLALAALALVAQRPLGLAAITVAGAAFYPVVAVVCGLALALWMGLPGLGRAGAPPWRRASFVALTALVTLLVLAPVQQATRPYGPRIGTDELRDFPEAGPGGRYPLRDVPPYPRLASDLGEALATSVAGRGRPWAPSLQQAFERQREWSAPALAVVLAAVLVLGARRDVRLRRLLLLLVAAAAAHLAARIAAPQLFLPSRYTAYAVPVVVIAGLPAALAVLLRSVPRWRGAGIVAGCALLVLVVGGRGSEGTGLTVRYDALPPVVAWVASLPKDARIAAWPRGAADDLPYLARRSVLHSRETHQAFHQGYVRDARLRMQAFLDAYYARSQAPLERLRDELGVTHLLVDRRHFPEPPLYFEPFDPLVRRAAEQLGGQPAQWARETGAWVRDDGPWLLLDLGRLGAAPSEAPLESP